MKSCISLRGWVVLAVMLVSTVGFCTGHSHATFESSPQYVDSFLMNSKSNANYKEIPNHPISFQPEMMGPQKKQYYSDIKVIPGGQTIGVKIKSNGMMVVGFHTLRDTDASSNSPAQLAKIEIGDLITHLDGTKITSMNQFTQLINDAGKKDTALKLTLLRRDAPVNIICKPKYDANERTYRMGLYIRDSAAGIGTLTFYAPDYGVYGALGHVISDMDTKLPISVEKGEILYSQVTSISKSQNGDPGEKRAQIFKDRKAIGNIEKNTPFGIFGKMNHAPENGYQHESILVATQDEVQEGPASIYTVIDGQKVEKYEVEVIHKSKQSSPSTKGMVIKITDSRLLEKTGGIIQGMSGSPIIQNGKLIGAVTHVFVNDPQSGYGCYIEWMLKDAGVSFLALQEPKAC